MEDYYTVNVRCDNCGYSGDVKVPRGTKVSNRSCPRCGCRTLKRKDKWGFSMDSFWKFKKYPRLHGKGRTLRY